MSPVHPTGNFRSKFLLAGENRLVRKKDLETYLQDHFAGSVAALEAIDHLATIRCDNRDERFFLELRKEIQEDQGTLQQILHSLGMTAGPVRNTAAYFGEKLARLKLRLEDPGGIQLAHLEQIEALALGIEGKRALWNTLLAIQEDTPSLEGIDFGRLYQRANEQRKRVETQRIEWARKTFI